MLEMLELNVIFYLTRIPRRILTLKDFMLVPATIYPTAVLCVCACECVYVCDYPSESNRAST